MIVKMVTKLCLSVDFDQLVAVTAVSVILIAVVVVIFIVVLITATVLVRKRTYGK